MEFFPDKFAIITERIESQGQIFLYIRGKNRDTYFKAMGKTGYQLLTLFFQKDIYHLHARNDTIFQAQEQEK
jgi:hypothetical protein